MAPIVGELTLFWLDYSFLPYLKRAKTTRKPITEPISLNE